MKIESDTKLDFDDVLIKPKWSDIKSRSEVNLSRSFKFRNSKAELTCTPILAANMDTVSTDAMARALAEHGCIAALHKFHEIKTIKQLTDDGIIHFYTLGSSDEDFNKLKNSKLYPAFICLDIANGYSDHFLDAVKRIRDNFPASTIAAGNVATPEMVQALILHGHADIVKVGIGPGSVCETRRVTGVGYPQLSCIAEAADVAHGLNAHIIADGGCRTPGDVAKAFGAGADFVMLGGMLAGHDECAGEIVQKTTNGHVVEKGSTCFLEDGYVLPKKYMKFYGMSSKTANEKYNGGLKGYKAAEGKEILVEYKGPVSGTLEHILGGLRSTCAYIGARSIKDLPKCCTFIRVNRVHS